MSRLYAPVSVGGMTTTISSTPGGLGRADGHQQRGGIRRRAAGAVDADASQRPVAQVQFVLAGDAHLGVAVQAAPTGTAARCTGPGESHRGTRGRRRRGPRPAPAGLTRSVSGLSFTLSNCSV